MTGDTKAVNLYLERMSKSFNVQEQKNYMHKCLKKDNNGGAGVAQWQFSDDAEQELWDVLGSNPALHP